MNFQETGNKIPVTEAELIDHMIVKYDAYAKSQNTQNPLANPDKDSVIYNTKNGKTIKIPDEIKMKAKTIWLKDVINKVKNNEINAEDMGVTVPPKVVKIYDNSQKFTNIIILIVAVIVAAYLLYAYGNRFRDMYNTGTEELKFYLGKK
jgi:hypothetical protein